MSSSDDDSMAEFHRVCYVSRVDWRTNKEALAMTDERQLQIPIKFNHYKLTRSGYIVSNVEIEVEAAGVSDDPAGTLETDQAIMVTSTPLMISRITEVIKSLGVPEEDEQYSIIVAKILDHKVVPVMEESPHHVFVNVNIYEWTWELLHWNIPDEVACRWHDEEVPVMNNGLELGGDSCANWWRTCAICKKDFDFENQGDNKLTRLTCLHLYHEHCIAPWVKISQGIIEVCPICCHPKSSDRKERPTGIHGQEGNPDEPTSLQLTLLIKFLSICYIIFLFLLAMIKFLLRKGVTAVLSK